MYSVLVSKPAQRDAQEHYDWWAEHRSAEQAVRWYAAFYKALLKLEKNPERFPLAAENGTALFQLRQLNFGLGARPTHRAVFVIRDSDIVVLRVRHLAQDALTDDDL